MKRFRRIFVMLALAVSGASPVLAEGEYPVAEPIRNGRESTHQTYVGQLESKGFSCTATLLPGTRCILTAGHCTTGAHGLEFRLHGKSVPAGSFSSPRTGADRSADLAIGRLETLLPIHTEIFLDLGPGFVLADPGLHLQAGARLVVAGFGETDSETVLSQPTLLEGDVVFSHYTPASPLGRQFLSTTMALNPGSAGSALCAGDSGGPVFANNQLVGVNSSGWEREPPAFVCTADIARGRRRPSRKARGCRSDAKGQLGCTDGRRKLRWGPLLRKHRFAQYRADFAAALGLRDEEAHSYELAHSFCGLLNTPRELEPLLESVGIRRSARYFRLFRRASARGRDWRLPSVSELQSIATGRGAKHHRVRKTIQSELGTLTVWAQGDRGGNLRPVVDLRGGQVSSLPRHATSCDRQVLGEAVSVAEYREWIDRTMEELHCSEI